MFNEVKKSKEDKLSKTKFVMFNLITLNYDT